MNIVIEESGPALFVATLNGELLPPSKTPLLSAARFLLRAGADPATELTMSRADGVISMRTTVGDAAKRSVSEPDDGAKPPRFVPYRPFPSGIPFKPVR